ncbi:MAG: hypothetical protein Q7R70_00535 [Candidatus Diapherotrites archaeon]|nr:hypothetical protein [Candidatus Diapherotrites archaeon]
MGFNRTSLIAIVISLAVLAGEFLLIFNGPANPAKAVIDMASVTINGVIMAFALMLLLIGALLLAN